MTILIQEYLFEVITRVAPDKKPAISHASLILKDFDPPLYELPFFKEVPMSKTLLSFSSKNDEKVFKLGIHTSKGVHSSLISELSHRGNKDFFEVEALPSTNNEDKVFNLSILIQEYLFEVITRVAPDKKPAISHASLILKDFDPPLYELPFFKEVPMSKTLLSFSSKNDEKVFKLGIHTSKGVHSSLISELSHRGYKEFSNIEDSCRILSFSL
nr:hypothetical protein [Tanacetum cinerariifolium]